MLLEHVIYIMCNLEVSKNSSRNKLWSLIFGIQLLIIDQLVKSFFINFLKKTPEIAISIFKYFKISYVWNYGISFGIFNYYYDISNNFFLIVNTIIVLCICYLITKAKKLLQFNAYMLIIIGGTSNIIDRMLYGAVFDFIDIYLIIFNLADLYIFVGTILLVIYYSYYE
ncbi:signal peptidase (SPase) II family protein [Orientia tsutsugamushi str. UT76]|uniref:Lipoprotein signal peptidase n=1 Tax=Orientia tsutsugamushi TaxID=784 RepID=A0A2U3R030_ORITS|nr:signal peptidase (SPase) II family protein [Orientia tsutsugamushi str. UT76]QES96518.1 lipoprotein signal peptidase [Orientia tsutsugamushi]SPR06590.1 peptidase A8 [Orientia tsutsugamushi]